MISLASWIMKWRPPPGVFSCVVQSAHQVDQGWSLSGAISVERGTFEGDAVQRLERVGLFAERGDWVALLDECA